MSQRTSLNSSPLSQPTDRAGAVFVPVALLGTAAVLLFNPLPDTPPPPPAVSVAPRMVETEPIRDPALRPEIAIGGYTYKCNDCHALFPSPPETFRTLTQHRDIVLKHGINTRCFNCHHLTDRNAFADDWGGTIPFDQPQHLCAKCHGPVYRDWVSGAHGRTEGAWNYASPRMKRLKCIECHDPHAPPFPSLVPAPAPRTLRMGDQKEIHHEAAQSPLIIYRRQDVTDEGHLPIGDRGQPGDIETEYE